jgi:hypothetical protein
MDKIEHKEISKKGIIYKINEKIIKFERIIELLNLKVDGDLTINDDTVAHCPYYKERYLKWIEGYFFNDEFLKIRLLICDTRKPVNKFSIVAVGKTPFEKYLGNGLYTYGLDLNVNAHNTQLLIIVKGFPSREDAEKWMKKRKNHILEVVIYRYKKLKAEYLKIIKKYRNEDNLLELIEAKEMAEKL